VLRAHHFPELASDLVPTLPPLDVKDLTHFSQIGGFRERCVGREREREREREDRDEWENVGTEEGRFYRESEWCEGSVEYNNI
jgi:hypothetical protein